MYDRLRAQGLSPNSTTYNALITAHGKACNLEMARRPAPLPCPGLPAGLSNKTQNPASGVGGREGQFLDLWVRCCMC